MFHSLILGRKKFGCQGWSRNYNFNDGDLTICGDVLHNYLTKYDKVPYADLAYKVISKSDSSSGSNQLGVYELQEIITGSSSQIIGMTAGYFYTKDTKNRYNYIKSLKIDRSNINSGIFRRPYIKESIIQSDTYDSSDKEYNNLSKISCL
jgi:hypothetical protein